MDIETLREISLMVERLGAEGKAAFIWYLVLSKLPVLLFGTIWSVIGSIAIHKGYKLILGMLVSEQLRKAAGVSYWSDRTLSVAIRLLSEHSGSIYLGKKEA